MSPRRLRELAERDRRAVVLGLAACLRRRLPRLEQIDRVHGALLESVEAWARGESPDVALEQIRSRARHVRGAHELCRLVDLATVDLEEIETKTDELLLLVAMGVWAQTDAGRAWSADPGNHATPYLQDPVASRGVLECKADLWALTERVAEAHAGAPMPVSTSGGVFEEAIGTDGAIWIIRTEVDVRPGDAIVVGSRAHAILRAEALRSPFDPPPPRRIALQLRERTDPPAPGAEVAFVRRG